MIFEQIHWAIKLKIRKRKTKSSDEDSVDHNIENMNLLDAEKPIQTKNIYNDDSKEEEDIDNEGYEKNEYDEQDSNDDNDEQDSNDDNDINDSDYIGNYSNKRSVNGCNNERKYGFLYCSVHKCSVNGCCNKKYWMIIGHRYAEIINVKMVNVWREKWNHVNIALNLNAMTNHAFV